MADTDTRMAYINGRVLRETEITVSIRDMGLVYGDSVFDTARTFYGWTPRSDVSARGLGWGDDESMWCHKIDRLGGWS